MTIAGSVGCSKLLHKSDDDAGATAEAPVPSATAPAASVSAAPEPSASAAHAAASATNAGPKTCPDGHHRFTPHGRPALCLKICQMDGHDCARGETCDEAPSDLDPEHNHMATYCIPAKGGGAATAGGTGAGPSPNATPAASAGSTTKGTSKCPAGTTLIYGRGFVELCSTTCKTDADCKSNGPCEEANTPSGATAKICGATGEPPK